MHIGVPKETKSEEQRVGMTPAGVETLVAAGHRVVVERHAGFGTGTRGSFFFAMVPKTLIGDNISFQRAMESQR